MFYSHKAGAKEMQAWPSGEIIRKSPGGMIEAQVLFFIHITHKQFTVGPRVSYILVTLHGLWLRAPTVKWH